MIRAILLIIIAVMLASLSSAVIEKLDTLIDIEYSRCVMEMNKVGDICRR